jgi:nucleoside-diphosphate-sugar epimerase
MKIDLRGAAMEEVFIAGCGYVGERVARVWLERGARVRALVRRSDRAECLHSLGVVPVHGDLDLPGTLTDLPGGGALVYYFAPPPKAGTTDPRIRAFLAAVDRGAPPLKAVYISTTGVYGDLRGGWANENTPAKPMTPRARRRWDAESTFRRWEKERGVPVIVLRVPGIYGPGRIPAERIRKGIPVVREEDAPFTNRIHVEDLVRACIAAGLYGRPGAVYNVSDGSPGTMTQYFFAVADALGLPRPPALSLDEASRSLNPQLLSFLRESRRIDNSRMREELCVRPLYPDLRSGLAACLAAEKEAP